MKLQGVFPAAPLLLINPGTIPAGLALRQLEENNGSQEKHHCRKEIGTAAGSIQRYTPAANPYFIS
ncbi:MAG: hypothetical protein HQ483_06070 [Rhodospirillales bacterium]|nr:hypothetical protein [Rhodospirillales bacterium]